MLEAALFSCLLINVFGVGFYFGSRDCELQNPEIPRR